MRRLDRLGLAATALVLVLAALFAVRVAAHYGARAELGRVKLSAVADDARAYLEGLQSEVLATYYVSPASEMPSRLKRLERSVLDVLEAFHEASRGAFQYQIVDPSTRPELVSYTAGQRVAPFRVRSVTRDSYSEATVWSTLTLAYGVHPPAMIHGLLPEHLPRLQDLILGHLRQMDEPRPPVFAIDPGERHTYADLRSELAFTGEVLEVDLEAGDPIPERADLLLWMDPGDVEEEQLVRLSRFLEGGGSAAVWGSTHEVDGTSPTEEGAFEVRPTDFDAQTLLGSFGLRPAEDLVLDQRCEVLQVGDIARQLPFHVHCIAPNQDFHTWRGQPNGHLLFTAPTPAVVEGDLAAELGWRPEVLATTSDRTWTQPDLGRRFDLEDLDPDAGRGVPKQPLLTWLRPVDPWRGSILFAASSSPLRDGTYLRDGYAHENLVRVLLRTLVSDERIVNRRAGVGRLEPLPEQPAGERLLWRAVVIGALPAVLLLLALRRRVGQGAGPVRTATALGRSLLRPALAAAAVLVVTALVHRTGLGADATEDGLNRLAPQTVELARGLPDLEVELYASSADRLPPEMRPGVRELRNTLRDLRRAAGRFDVVSIDPADESDAERERLRAAGIEPVRVQSRGEEVTTVRTVYSTVRLTARGRSELVAFDSADAFENLELRLAFALWRLESGETPHVAFASDLPRLSAAEAHEDYQLRGKFAPTGTDVYSLARETLGANDFRVSHVNPQAPAIPEDADCLVWMQPRRDVTRMLEAAVTFLRSGRPVLLAAQHFIVQPRQYPGTGFEVVYWPQPQSCDVERLYFPGLGIHLVREVQYDELKTTLAVETHVNRDQEERDYEAQDSALPFLIRASASNFAPDSPITAGLGDQAFLWGNRIEVDEDALAENGLTFEPLITTSARSWSYAWSGGWLPPASLEGPVDAEGEPLPPGEGYDGKVPLAGLFRGTFPVYRAPDPATGEVPELGPVGPGEPSRLLLVGGSELFKNYRLLEPDFRADHLLLNAVFDLAVGPELSVVAGRRLVPRGFDYVPPDTRLAWRAAVLGTGPLLLLAYGLVHFLRGRRPPRRPARAATAPTP